MKPGVQGECDRRGARAKARRSPPCSFNWLIMPSVDQEFHHLKLTIKLSGKGGALHPFTKQFVYDQRDLFNMKR